MGFSKLQQCFFFVHANRQTPRGFPETRAFSKAPKTFVACCSGLRKTNMDTREELRLVRLTYQQQYFSLSTNQHHPSAKPAARRCTSPLVSSLLVAGWRMPKTVTAVRSRFPLPGGANKRQSLERTPLLHAVALPCNKGCLRSAFASFGSPYGSERGR